MFFHYISNGENTNYSKIIIKEYNTMTSLLSIYRTVENRKCQMLDTVILKCCKEANYVNIQNILFKIRKVMMASGVTGGVRNKEYFSLQDFINFQQNSLWICFVVP